jgi:hypothetical protein
MQIGVADAARFGLDQNLAGSGHGNIPFPENERLSEFFDDGGVHLECHAVLLLWKSSSLARRVAPSHRTFKG